MKFEREEGSGKKNGEIIKTRAENWGKELWKGR